MATRAPATNKDLYIAYLLVSYRSATFYTVQEELSCAVFRLASQKRRQAWESVFRCSTPPRSDKKIVPSVEFAEVERLSSSMLLGCSKVWRESGRGRRGRVW